MQIKKMSLGVESNLDPQLCVLPRRQWHSKWRRGRRTHAIPRPLMRLGGPLEPQLQVVEVLGEWVCGLERLQNAGQDESREGDNS